MRNQLAKLTEYALTANPWTTALGAVRAIIAFSALLTLSITPLNVLIRPAAGVPDPLHCTDIVGLTIWCVAPSDQLWIPKTMAIVTLALVVIGWRPAITAIPLAWVMFSINAGFTVVDGGDQVGYVLSVALLPISLTDPRRWHWTSLSPDIQISPYRRIIGVIGVWGGQVQVSYIYINACLTKLSSKEWVDGTSIYYWFTNPMLGAPQYLRPIAEAVTLNPFGVSIINWAVLVLEFLLGISMLLNKSFRKPLFVAGIGFHLGIGVLFGLWSFAFIMCAALVLLLFPFAKLSKIKGLPEAAKADSSDLDSVPGTRPRMSLWTSSLNPRIRRGLSE